MHQYNTIKRLLRFVAVVVFIGRSHAQSNVASEPITKPVVRCVEPSLIPGTRDQISKSLRGNGMCFTQNKGQLVDMKHNLRPDILYKGEGGGAGVYIRKTGISYEHSNMGEVMHEVEEQIEEKEKYGKLNLGEEQQLKEQLMQKAVVKLHRIDVDFEGANKITAIQTADPVEGYTNYYYAHCPNGITHVNSYNEVTVKNIYNNIDVKYYGGKAEGLKYDIVVNPGGNPKQIKLHWKGAEELTINNGKIKIKTSVNEFVESIPKVYQIINGKIVDIKIQYVLDGTTVSFELGTWNPKLSLVIDPWVTYYGGTNTEEGRSVNVDKQGNVVFTGSTFSFDFPFSVGAFQTAMKSIDAYVVKMTSSGSRVFATYFGGNQYETGIGIATDNNNNIFIAGITNSINLPNKPHPSGSSYGQTYIGGRDGFIAEFDLIGTLIWSTYFGGTKDDNINDICCDPTNNIFILGSTSSANIPIMTPYQLSLKGPTDCFIAKFNISATLQWSTYYGGNSIDEGWGGITCDNLGNLFFAGHTSSNDFPILFAFQPLYSGPGAIGYGDAFIVKLNPTTGFPVWSTYFGGSKDDYGGAIATDNSNNVVITGSTNSVTKIASSAFVFQPNFAGGPYNDSFVAKFDNSGNLLWSTYLGGSVGPLSGGGNEEASGIAIDSNNNIVVSGDTYSTNFPVTSCAYQKTFKGSEDQYITTFDANGTLICSGYMGTGNASSENNETYVSASGGSIAVDGCFVYLVATTQCNYPFTSNAFQTSCVPTFGGWPAFDAVLAKLYVNTCGGITTNLNFSTGPTTFCNGQSVNFTSAYSACGGTAGITYLWIFTGAVPNTSTAKNPTGIVYNSPGNFNVKLVIQLPCGKDSIEKVSYITVDPCGGITASVNSATICSGTTPCPTLTAIGASGTAPYTYLWNTTENTQNINPCPGSTTTYTVTIKDAGGNSSTSTAVVTVNPAVTVSTTGVNITCNGSADGSVIAAGGSGTLPYTYSWSNGGTASQISNLTSQIYTVTITDSKGCTSASSATIISPPALTGQFTKGTANCVACACKEWILVNASGGTSPYSYAWPDGYINRFKNQLCPGAYMVNIKDKNGCSVNINLTTP
ncbi:MAG: SBBP repeat-containing protein [Bacteroidetes bacterium]|nr:SBBP repeat-containing protein [Bacteroidota bacterium]